MIENKTGGIAGKIGESVEDSGKCRKGKEAALCLQVTGIGSMLFTICQYYS